MIDKKTDHETIALKECICEHCPSFEKCKEKIGYCVVGRSKCIKERKWCICGWCPVHQKLNLEGGYFCL
jgi:hypothetical protein